MKSISGKNLCKIILTKGWKLKRIMGSHYIFNKDESPLILSVPVHGNKDIPIGTLKGIMKIVELTENDLL